MRTHVLRWSLTLALCSTPALARSPIQWLDPGDGGSSFLVASLPSTTASARPDRSLSVEWRPTHRTVFHA